MLYATAYDFVHGGLGQPDVGRTILYLGEGVLEDFKVSERPEDTLVTVQLVEDDFNRFKLPAGSYWIMSTNDADVAIVSCEANGVSSHEQKSSENP